MSGPSDGVRRRRPEPPPPGSVRRILLVGFMASGKSTVGPRLARRLGWTFVDVDAEVERREGRSVSEIFTVDGEAAFRRLEEEAARSALELDRAVLAPGGGWPAAPGRLDALPPGTLSVWLRVGLDEALRRARGDGPVRPLLEGPEAERRAAELMAAREPWYALAHLRLDVDRASPDTLVRTIVEALGG